MTTDRYIKCVLTVIAACLLWICGRDVRVVQPAFGQPQQQPAIQRVEIVGIRAPGHREDQRSTPRPVAWDPIGTVTGQ